MEERARFWAFTLSMALLHLNLASLEAASFLVKIGSSFIRNDGSLIILKISSAASISSGDSNEATGRDL
jgi:hypothetical protein